METEVLTVWRRLRTYPVEKSLGPTAAITVFFVIYFYILEHPPNAPRLMPISAIDLWVPVVSWSAWLYFSLWVYICIPQALMVNRRLMLCYLCGAVLLSTIGLSFFFFYPTAVPAWGIDWSLYPTLQFLKNSDQAGNACPSLHVGFATFSGCWLVWLIRQLSYSPVWGLLIILWGVAIIISTMTTKQHALIDVIFGFLLGGLVFWVNMKFVRTLESKIMYSE